MSENPRLRLTRRQFLKQAGAIVGLAAASAIPGCRPSEAKTTTSETQSPSIGHPYLDVVKKTTGEIEFIIVNDAQVVQIQAVPYEDPKSRREIGDNVWLFRETIEKDGAPISPADIKANTAARVLGAPHRFGDYNKIQAKDAAGKMYSGGEWFVLMDKNKNLINSKGQPLLPGEKPYYLVSGQVNIM